MQLSQVKEYRAMALTCARLAKKIRDPYSKIVLVRSAEKWRALADMSRARANTRPAPFQAVANDHAVAAPRA